MTFQWKSTWLLFHQLPGITKNHPGLLTDGREFMPWFLARMVQALYMLYNTWTFSKSFCKGDSFCKSGITRTQELCHFWGRGVRRDQKWWGRKGWSAINWPKVIGSGGVELDVTKSDGGLFKQFLPLVVSQKVFGEHPQNGSTQYKTILPLAVACELSYPKLQCPTDSGITTLIKGAFEWLHNINHLQHRPGKYNTSIPLLHLCLLQPNHRDFYLHRDFSRNIFRKFITSMTFKWKSPWLLFAPWLFHRLQCDFYLTCV